MTNGLLTNFYDLLGIDCNASREDIIQQFILLSNQTTNLTEKIQIYRAYQVLIDNNQRKAYDKALLMGLLSATPAPTVYSQSDKTLNSYPINLYMQQSQSFHSPPTYTKMGLCEEHEISNKREFLRLPFECHLIINDNIETNTVNISPKGLQIELPRGINLEDFLYIQSKFIKGCAQLRFIEGQDNDKKLAGLCFVDVTFSPQLLINEYI